MMEKCLLSQKENLQIQTIIEELRNEYGLAENEEFITNAMILANELPDHLIQAMHDLSDVQEHSGLLLIKGFEPREALPSTPKSWFKKDSYSPCFESDFLAIMLASVLGEPFGFETQQKGKLIHDIVPIKGREYAQEGANSLEMLNFHTEDAFHPFRADYICLHCLKNPSQIGTLVSGVRDFALTPEEIDILFESRFHHLSDDTHTENTISPPLDSILFGNKQSPYIRFDCDFSIARDNDWKAKQIVSRLKQEIDRCFREVPLSPGDFCFIDNYKWLHGRKSFKANYDGHDRWLRRFNIKTDLFEAADYRVNSTSRMLSFNKIHTRLGSCQKSKVDSFECSN